MPVSDFKFSVGDRVAERIQHGRPVVAKPGTRSHEEVCAYLREIRCGEITAIEERRIKNGSRCTYLQVRWDGLRSSSWHARHRVQPIIVSSNVETNTLKRD